MQSEARQVLHKTFESLELGTRFHLVNTVFGGAIPNAMRYEKVNPFEKDGFTYNALKGPKRKPVIIKGIQKCEIC